MPLNPVIITFDDGDISNYKIAWPILKEFKLKASFFLLVSNIGSEGFMSREEIKELSKGGVEIGSHGLTHRALTVLGDDILVNELENSKDILAKILGSPVELLSLPGGFCNRRVKEVIRNTGYKIVCTSCAGVNDVDTDELSLKRIAIRSDTSFEEFIRLLESPDSAFTMERFKAAGRGAFKRVIGIKNYTFIKKRLIGAKR